MKNANLKYTPTRHLRIGDRVVMNMDEESRSWGRPGPKDGAEGNIIGFVRYPDFRSRLGRYSKVEPGIYEGNGVPIIHWDGFDVDPTLVNGHSHFIDHDIAHETGLYLGTAEDLRTVMEFSRTSCDDMALVDQEEAERRYQEEWMIPVLRDRSISAREQEVKLLNIVRLGDLPETMAWEGDIIYPKNPSQFGGYEDDEPAHMRVRRIEYRWGAHSECAYSVGWHDDATGEDAGRGTAYIYDKDIDRVERGNVWKHYNGEPLSFKSLEEEVYFAREMGMTEELRNPKTQTFSWDLEEALDAIEGNQGHGFSKLSLPAGLGGSRISVYRYLDEDLAQRVRARTLKGFGRGEALAPQI